MSNPSESFLSSQKSLVEETKTETKLGEEAGASSTDITGRSERPSERVEPAENVFLTAYLQAYNTLKVNEGKNFGPIEPVVTACRIDNDAFLIAAGCDDGTIKLYMPEQSKYFGQVSFSDDEGNAILDLRWRPTRGNSMTEHVFMASDVFGYLYHVHATSKKILHKSHEEGNQIYALDYNVDGSRFATGGKDCHVRVYDEHKKTNFVVLEPNYNLDLPIHSNRILAMKFSQKDPEILVTGSWDETVKVWDLRIGKVVRSLFKMKVFGDGLDIDDDVILTGHNREKNQLQLWDMGTGKLIEDIVWDPKPNPTGEYRDNSITAAKFSKSSSNYIVAFSGLTKQVRIFDRKNGNRLCYVAPTVGEVNTLDFFTTSDTFVYGGKCGGLITCKIG